MLGKKLKFSQAQHYLPKNMHWHFWFIVEKLYNRIKLPNIYFKAVNLTNSFSGCLKVCKKNSNMYFCQMFAWSNKIINKKETMCDDYFLYSYICYIYLYIVIYDFQGLHYVLKNMLWIYFLSKKGI